MDEQLQGPLRKLAEALHRAIEESPDVERALGVLRERGLSAVLLLEVTVALSRTETGEAVSSGAELELVSRGGEAAEDEWVVELPADDTEPVVPRVDAGAPSDREFLRSLRIRLD